MISPLIVLNRLIGLHHRPEAHRLTAYQAGAWAQAAHIIDYLDPGLVELSFGWRKCIDIQGVDIRLHHWSQGLVNKPVAFDSASVGKGVGDDSHLEVAHAVAGAGVPCMQMTLILDLQM
jgi:hypothetical protein